MTKERPITMSAPMVRKLLRKEKTQTRRLVNLATLRVRLHGAVSSVGCVPPIIAPAGLYPARLNQHGAVSVDVNGRRLGVKPGEFDFVCPYASGSTYLLMDRWNIAVLPHQYLWVKETFALSSDPEQHERDVKEQGDWDGAVYKADDTGGDWEYYEPDGTRRKIPPPWRSPRFMPR